MFDGLRKSETSVFRFHDKSGVGHKFFVVPGFNVAESGKVFAMHRDNGFPFKHFLFHIFRVPFCDACSPDFRGILYGLEDLVHIRQMLFSRDSDCKIIYCHRFIFLTIFLTKFVFNLD